jgi:hypothetical protein
MTLTGNLLNNNLVAFYPMTDGSGGIADISGNGYDGVATDSPVWLTTSKGTAPGFPGSGRFEVPAAMWTAYFNGNTAFSVRINIWDGVGSEFLLRFDNSRLQVLTANGGFQQTSTLAGVTASTPGVWEHFVATVDMTGEIKIYLNKNLITTRSCNWCWHRWATPIWGTQAKYKDFQSHTQSE